MGGNGMGGKPRRILLNPRYLFFPILLWNIDDERTPAWASPSHLHMPGRCLGVRPQADVTVPHDINVSAVYARRVSPPPSLLNRRRLDRKA